jgi:hypothetical protein
MDILGIDISKDMFDAALLVGGESMQSCGGLVSLW